jgi:hypothetical protein
LNNRLHISRHDDARDYSEGKHFRFAVTDLEKDKNYPANFVCMLPLNVEFNGKAHNIFTRIFGSDSLKVAKWMLLDALEREKDSAIRDEIERRLKLLDSKSKVEVVCVSCGNPFQKKTGKSFKQRFCQECLMKRFAGRK